MKYPNLFSPMKIGTLEIRNRVVMTPMGCSMANVDGSPSEQMIAYYTARARGGVGLICTEITRVRDLDGVGETAQLSVSKNSVIPGLTKLADSVHRQGAKIFVQIHHPGRQTGSFTQFGVKPVAPSAVTCQIIQEEPRALETEEVKEIIQNYIDGAWRAQQAGIDGVEIHAAHGYLLNQFLSPHTNKRTDVYGGSLENRGRAVVEIIKGIKDLCGPTYPVTVRISVEEFLGPEGLELPEGVAFCKMFEAAGADGLGISSGIYETMNTIVEPTSYQEGWRIHLSEAVKKAVTIPIYGNAVIRHPDYAEKLLAEGTLDFIGMGRPHLADPEWCNKAKNGQDDRIRHCISCLRCFETIFTQSAICQPVQCSVNAQLGREARNPYPEKDGAGRVVAIVGGGPAGLEAARVLAERHFKPVIFEASGTIGGQLALAKNPPGKDKLAWFTSYLDNELNRLGVEIRLHTRATAENISALNPHAVILATGSTPLIPASIPGVGGDNVYSVSDILSGAVKLEGKKVVLIGSGMTGIETAEMLADAGNTVSVVEMQDTIAPDGYWQNVIDVLGHLKEKNVELLPKHTLLSIGADNVKLDGAVTEIPCDAVVLSLGVKSEDSLFKEISGSFTNIYNIGDSKKIGRIVNAVTEGYLLAYNLK